MSKFVKLSIVFVLLVSCNYENRIERKSEFVIIDTLPITNSFISKNWKERELYKIKYLGVKKDSIFVNHNPYPVPPPPPGVPYDTIEFLRKKDTEIFNSQIEKFIFKIDETSNMTSIYYDSIEVYVDTKQIIGKNSYIAYPVIIENKHFDSLSVSYAYRRSIYAILEAKDSIGNWKPINKENYAHGLPIDEKIVLLKNHIIITSVYSNFGEFNTELRLKVGNNYSNVFSGRINYNQFQSESNENRNYKEN